MIRNHCENDYNNVSRKIVWYRHILRDQSIPYCCLWQRGFKLNISVGRKVSALRQIKSFKRCRKRSTRTKWRIAEESDATRGFHLKKRVASERKHLNGSVLDTRTPVLSGINEEESEEPGASAVWQGRRGGGGENWEEGEDWNFNCVYFGPTRSIPSHRRSGAFTVAIQTDRGG